MKKILAALAAAMTTISIFVWVASLFEAHHP